MSQKAADRLFESLESRTLLAVFTVDTLADGVDGNYSAGNLSLREAIQLANTDPARDEIRFAQGIHGGTINLLLGQLEITEDLDIIGPGSDKLTINAGGNSRILAVNIGTAEDVRDVRLEGMMLIGGKAEFGGAIHSKENLDIRDAIISSNEATFWPGGGGIEARDTTVVVRNSIVSGNISKDSGGGIHARSVTVEDSIFSGNTSLGGGGGVSLTNGGTTVVKDSIFTANSAPGGSGLLAIDHASVLIMGSQFVGNVTGAAGGAVAVLGISVNPAIAIEGSAFISNENGALIADALGMLMIVGIKDSVFNDNTSTSAGFGAVSLGYADADVNGCQFSGNSGPSAGAISISAGNLSILNSEFTGNVTTDHAWGTTGGTIAAGTGFAGTLAIIDSSLTGNTGTKASAVHLNSQAAGGVTLFIERTTIKGNSSDNADYGTISVVATNGVQPHQVTVRDSIISENTGRGLNLWGHTVIERSTITGNTTTGWGGGLYHFGNDGSLEVIDSRFEGNQASQGGGLYAGGRSTTIRGSLFLANSSSGQGGGLFLGPTHDGSGLILNSTISGNSAVTNGGGLFAARTTIANSTIVGNTADANGVGFQGGGIWFATYSGQDNENYLYSSIVAHNTRTNAAQESQTTPDPAGESHNLIGGDPMLAPLGDYGGPTPTYALRAGSPAIDAGSNPQNLDTDARGKARVFGAAADIGAFEHNGPPAVVSLTPSVTPVGLSDSFTLTAIIADPGDAPIVEVRFYHDANRNGVPDGGELLSTDSDASNGWATAVGPFPGAGPAETFIAVAVNAIGFSNDGFAADVAFDASNEHPVVQSLIVSSGAVERGASFILTATATDEDGTIVEVRFLALFDLNGDGVVDANDVIVDSDGSNGFTAVIAAAASSRIPTGEPARFRLIAVDNVGASSEPTDFEFDSWLSRFLHSAAHVSAASDSGDTHRIIGVNMDGRVFVFEPTDTGWRVLGASAGELATFTGPSTTWTDPKDGLVYAAAVTNEGLVLLRRGFEGQWTVRLLTTELAGSIAPARAITHFISTDGIIVLVGVAQDGRMVAFQQTGAADVAGNPLWTFVNISDDHLTPQGMATPDLNDLIAYVTNWNAWHLAGIDADGNIQSVWIMPGVFDLWRVDNLSEITGAPLISGQLAVTLTAWDGINLAGLNADGRLMVTWWVPQFGGDWLTNDLTENAGGPLLVPGQLTGYTTPWGGLNYAGLDGEGELTVYWWTPTLDLWVVSPLIEGLPEGATRPTGRLASHASAVGTLNILGVGPGGEVIRVHWAPGMDSWITENLSEVAVHA